MPPDIPTWGNIMAEGRALFRVFPHNIFFPGIFLALTVLAINILGDGLRDTLDPKMSKTGMMSDDVRSRRRPRSPQSDDRAAAGADRAARRRQGVLHASSRGEIVCLVGESGSGKSVIASPSWACWPRR